MVNGKTASVILLGIAGVPVYALNFGLEELCVKNGLIPQSAAPYAFFLCQFAPLEILYLGGVALVLRNKTHTKSTCLLPIILLFGLLYRTFLLPVPPKLSSDMYRYIWDGRVQAESINPYRYPPKDEALRAIRDGVIYPRINRKGSPTIYPAGAQILFYFLNRTGLTTVTLFKGAVILFDIASVLLLMGILKDLGFDRERVLVYAWNPLVIYELANNGHLDAFVIFFVLLAFRFFVKGRLSLSVATLAVASCLKLYPAVALPAVINERRPWRLAMFAGAVVLLYLPYLSAGRDLLGYLPEYFANPYESFNLGAKVYLLGLVPFLDHLSVTGLFSGVLALSAIAFLLRRKDKAIEALKSSYVLAGLAAILSTGSFHPWYALWIIPFLALFPSVAWFYLTGILPLSYAKYFLPGEVFPEWIRAVEYVPFFVLLVMEHFARRKRPAES